MSHTHVMPTSRHNYNEIMKITERRPHYFHFKVHVWYGAGGWRSATSLDGIHFTPERSFVSRFGAKAGTDGTGIFIDDDGIGYVVFAWSLPWQ